MVERHHSTTYCALVAAAALAGGPLPSPSWRILSAWIGAAALSSLAGFDPLLGLQVVAMMLLGAAFHLALVRYYDAPPVAALVVRVYLWTGLGASLAGIAMLLARRPLTLWVLNHGRAAGPFVTANQFAAFLIMFVFVALGTALATKRPGLRSLALAALAAGGAALGLTFSAAGWLGTAVAGVFLSYALGARRIAAGIVLAGVLGLAFLALSPVAGHRNPAEATSRFRIWSAGLRVAELFPLTGVGPMAYWRVYPAVRAPSGDPPGSFGALHPHDVYLSLAAETGVAGLCAALAGWYWWAASVRRELRGAARPARRFALGVCAGLVAVRAGHLRHGRGRRDGLRLDSLYGARLGGDPLGTRRRVNAPRARSAFGALVAAIALAGCGGSATQPPPPSPSPSVAAPSTPLEVHSHAVGSSTST